VISIRAPRPDELERLRDIEWAAGAMFIDVGLGHIAEHEPASVETLADYVAADAAYVIVVDDQVVGYSVTDMVDGTMHLEQLSVHPDHGRRGLGAALLEHVCDEARRGGFHDVTLTTFRDVAWNGPFYARHGFVVMTDDEIGPELRELRDHEAAAGLDPDLRACMRRALG
jgi:GNAT superfamily N-acetyltransferase